MNKSESIVAKIKQHFKKEKQQPENFVYAIDWLKSTEKLKTYDEFLISLMDYYSYIDTQKGRVQIYFAQKNKGLNPEALYTNFDLDKTDKATLDKMESQKYDAYIYSKHPNTVRLKNKDIHHNHFYHAVVPNYTQDGKNAESFDSKK